MFKINVLLRNPRKVISEGFWEIAHMAEDNFPNFLGDLKTFLNTDCSERQEILKLKFASEKEFANYCENNLIIFHSASEDEGEIVRKCEEIHAFYWDILQACIELKTNGYDCKHFLSSIGKINAQGNMRGSFYHFGGVDNLKSKFNSIK
jgi:hypothetical protein